MSLLVIAVVVAAVFAVIVIVVGLCVSAALGDENDRQRAALAEDAER